MIVTKSMVFIMIQKTKLLALLNHYRKHIGGGMAAAFAIMLPLLIGATGMAVDVGEASHVRQRLCTALDASVLAGTSGNLNEDDITNSILLFFAKNYPSDAVGVADEPEIIVRDNEVQATVFATYYTRFMRVIGRKTITISCDTTVQRNVKGLEVVLVLDNTGSMRGANIAALKTASTNLVNILFQTAEEPEDVRIGIVPYAASVNVGPYGLGLDPDGNPYSVAFVNNPHGRTYSTNPQSVDDWSGCVLENSYNDDTTDNDGPWNMMESGYYNGQTCTGSWRNRVCVPRYYKYSCPQPVVPITSDQPLLLRAIDAMYAEGNTLGNIGMVWGYRMISPNYPFEEAASYDDPEWNKAIIMMTDGNNEMGTYTAYGHSNQHSVRNAQLNQRFEETCTHAKNDGIIVYTITFTSVINNSTKGFYRRCATDPSYYYDAPSQAQLQDVFEDIAYALAKLYIKN